MISGGLAHTALSIIHGCCWVKNQGDKMNIKIKKLNPNAVIPKYAKHGDACVDLIAVEKWIDDWGNICYNTGLSMEIPEGYVGFLFPRSSVSKTTMFLRNSVGVIDSGYRGPIVLKFSNKTKLSNHESLLYKIGDRVGQLMIMPHPKISFIESQNLSETDRGDGGFGSTGE